MNSFLTSMMDGYHWIFWILLALVALSAMRESLFKPSSPYKAEDPVTLLQLRFASGEISEDEYIHKLGLIHPATPEPSSRFTCKG